MDSLTNIYMKVYKERFFFLGLWADWFRILFWFFKFSHHKYVQVLRTGKSQISNVNMLLLPNFSKSEVKWTSDMVNIGLTDFLCL